MKKSIAALAIVIALPALASGCSTAPADAVTQTTVTIGVTPGADLAPLYMGVKQGFFAEQGINLTINSLAASSSAVLSAVDQEKFDFGFADAVSIMEAKEAGLGLEVISGAAATTGDPRLDYAAIVVHPSSAVDSLDDLRFLHMSVDAEGTINDLVAKSAVEASGIEVSSVSWHEIPFVDASEALTSRRVDAALVVEPFVTQARLAGFRVISYPYAEFDSELTVSGYVASSGLLEDDPELVERFITALDASFAYAEEETYEVRTNIGTYLSSEAAVEARLTLPRFTREFDRDALEKLAAAAVDHGFITQVPDLEALLP
ncbi:ABC transporter substrate-binding protein [Salinibacterium sp. SYSU T00001]|uniref:ABC transporter substrate-binding protein n=1 Tax=Homoserinimonas sedimenticola TaxID=2986805 RepID=UPI0022361816|nr:ABC transporter substrate-binding protein [Salinibacterium sedimenticola]MCW4386071.1 ABC transporter substrate-binding protein [Salinibacterium sedimenticola]